MGISNETFLLSFKCKLGARKNLVGIEIAIDAVFRHFLNAQAVKLFISPQVRHHYGNLDAPNRKSGTVTSIYWMRL